MTTLTEMIAEINGQMPGLPSAMVKDALNRSQRDVCRHWPWVWLESTWNLGTFTPISSPGYVTVDVTDVSSDRVTVTGVGTTFITSGLDDYAEFGTGTLTGVYRIRLNGQDQTYIIATVDGDTQLTLSSTTPYVGASLSASDEAEYSIYRNVYILDTTVEVIEGVRSSWGMTPIAQEDLDTIDPRRQTFGQPTRYLIGGGSTPTIELWPIPDADYLIQYWGIRRPVAMTSCRPRIWMGA